MYSRVTHGQEGEEEGTNEAKSGEEKKFFRVFERWFATVLRLGHDHHHSIAHEGCQKPTRLKEGNNQKLWESDWMRKLRELLNGV